MRQKHKLLHQARQAQTTQFTMNDAIEMEREQKEARSRGRTFDVGVPRDKTTLDQLLV